MAGMLDRWPEVLVLMKGGEKLLSEDGREIVLAEWSLSSQRMGTSSVEATLVWDGSLDAVLGYEVYVELDGQAYMLDESPSREIGTGLKGCRKYTLKFQSRRDCILGNSLFFDVVLGSEAAGDRPASGGTSFAFYGDISQFAARMQASLDARGLAYKVVVDEGVASEEQMVSFEGRTYMEALQDAYGVYGVPYWFEGDTVHFGYGSGLLPRDFAYGVDRELTGVKVAPEQVSRFTAVAPKGSSQNLPEDYPNLGPKGTLGLSSSLVGCTLAVSDQRKFGELVSAGDTLRAGKPGGITLVDSLCYMSPKYDGFPILPAEVPSMTDPDTGDYHFWTQGGYGTYSRTVKHTVMIAGSLVEKEYTLSEFYLRATFDAEHEGDYLLSAVVAQADEILTDRCTVYAYDGDSDSLSDAVEAYVHPDSSGATAEVLRTFRKGRNSFVFKFALDVSSSTAEAYKLVVQEEGVTADAQFSYLLCPDGKYRLPEEMGLEVTSGSLSSGSVLVTQVAARIPNVQNLMPPEFRESRGHERFIYAKNDTYPLPSGEGYREFTNTYSPDAPREAEKEFEEIYPTINGMTNASGEYIDALADGALFDLSDSGQADADGNPAHMRFALRLRKMDGANALDLFASASADGEMKLSFTSGPCAGCSFKVVVTEGYPRNPLLVGDDGMPQRASDGSLLTSSSTQERQNDTTSYSVWLLLEKDTGTFSVPLPDPGKGIVPGYGDTYVITGISLPQAYVTAAEERLRQAALDWLQANNTDMLQPSVTLSRIFLSGDGDCCSKITESSTVNIEIDGQVSTQYVGQLSVKRKPSEALPDVSVTVSGAISDNRGSLYRAVESALSTMKIAAGTAPVTPSIVVESGSRNFLSKVSEDTAQEKLTLLKGADIGNYSQGMEGAGGCIRVLPDGSTLAEFDRIVARRDASLSQVTVDETRAVSGNLILSPNAAVISSVEEISGGWRCYYETETASGEAVAARFITGDLVMASSEGGWSERTWWREVTDAGLGWFDLSSDLCAEGSRAPMAGDRCVQLGNVSDTTRQAALAVDTYGPGSPRVVFYSGIDSFTLEGKDMASLTNTESGEPFLYCYGSMYFGTRDMESNYMTFSRKEGDTARSLRLAGEFHIGAGSAGIDNLSEWADKQAQIDSALADSAAAKLAADNALATAEGAQSYIDSTISPEMEEMNRHLDGVVSSWFYPYSPSADNLPASTWTTDADKLNHVGDTFTNNQEYRSDEETPDAGKSWRWVQDDDGSFLWEQISDSEAVKALQNAAKAQTTADGKAQVFFGTPSGPYDVGDLWSQGSTGDLMICIKARTTSGYSASDWAKAAKYTDDTALRTFIEGDYADAIAELGSQIDGKAQTWYQSTNPSNSWDTSEDASHTGDLWYDTGTGKTYRWDGTQWQEQSIPDEVFDKIDGKAQIFVTQPAPPYYVGDLWVQGPGGDILRCITSRTYGSYSSSDWSLAGKYTDDTAANAAKELAEQAKSAADDAADAAASAKTEADTAISRLDDMASDSIISAVEKPALVQQRADIVSEYNQIVADCGKYSISYTAFKTAYDAAIAALDKYTADLTVDTAKESDYDDIAAYYAARQTVLDAIATEAKRIADDAMVKAEAAASDAASAIASAETAEKSVEELNGDKYFSIPEKRIIRNTMQAITQQKETALIYSGTIGRSMVNGDAWVKVTQADADSNADLAPFVGFYRSQNHDNSTYSTTKLTFTMQTDGIATVQVVSDGESSFDYLVLSKIDPPKDLTSDTLYDSTVVGLSTSGKRGTVYTMDYGLTAGTHTLQIMYRKDSSASSYTDSGYYRVTTELSEGYNYGLSGSFHETYDSLTDEIDPDSSIRDDFYDSYFVPLVEYLSGDTCYLWEDTVTEFPDGSFRDTISKLLRNYYAKETELRKLVTEKTVMSDYEYLKQVFGKGEVDLLGGAVLAEAVGVKNSDGEVEGLLNGSDTFSDSTHGKVILAGGIPSGDSTLDERVASAETVIYEDGTINTKKLEAEDGSFSGELEAKSGTIGGFTIHTSSLYGKSGAESSYSTLTLGPGQCLFTNSRTGTSSGTVDIKSALGMSVLPATWGIDKVGLGVSTSVTTNVAGDVVIAGYFSASGKNQDNGDPTWGSHALYLEKGTVAGFRPVTRVVTSGQTLSHMDSIIIARNTSSITLTLPSSPQYGQTYLIVHATSTSLTITGSSSHQITKLSENSTTTSRSSTNREGLLLVFDGSNWILMYLMD